MHELKKAALAAGLVSITAGGSLAADLPAPEFIEPIPIEIVSGWYLRGYIGMSNQQVDELENVLFAPPAVVQFLDSGDFDSAPFYGVGFGYRFNPWFRVDLTGEYRGRSSFSALDRYDITGDGIWDGTNDYSATKNEWLFLANAYVDLGTWWGVTPYVGAGLGTSRNTIDNFRDVNVPNLGVAYASSHSQWEFAWALHAGVGFEVTPNLTVDLGYRYVDLGDGQSGDIIAADGTNVVYNPMTFKDLTSHDVHLGIRYRFN